MPSIQRNLLTSAITSALCIALLLTACGQQSEQELLASAKSYLDKGDPKAASIQLKSALQKNDRNGQARFMLGSALLGTGELVAANVELRKASELKYDEAKVVPVLARTMLLLGEARKVTDQFDAVRLDNAAATADLKTTLAAAHVAQGQRERAQEALKAAEEAVPMFAPAVVWQARLKAIDGDMDAALALLDRVIAREPANEAASLFKAELLAFGGKNIDAALALWRKVLAEHPKSLPAHQSIIARLLQQGDIDAARAQFEQLKKVLPNQPETRFFEAQFALIGKDYKTAQAIVEQLLKAAPDNVKVLQLAGAIESRTKSTLQAQNHLARALTLAPNQPLTRQLLAESYLQSGQPGKAVEVIQALIEPADADPAMLALAGQAYLQAGDARRSEAVFARAAKADPKNVTARTALALSQLAKGDEHGFAELESVASSDTGPRADLALISARLSRNDLDGALKAIDELQRKLPDKPTAYSLRGRVQLQRNDKAAATASFEKALSFDPLYFPAVASLAALDQDAGKPEQAKKRFDDMLRADPKNYPAMLALAELKSRSGGTKAEVAALISEAIKLNPTDPAARVLLVNHHLVQGDTKAALNAAQDGAAALPDSPDMLDTLGRAQFGAGDPQQAISTFRKLAALQPTSPNPHLRLADAYLASNDIAAASQSLKRALDIQGDLLPAQRGLIALALRDKRPQDAMAVARTVQTQRPTEAAGFVLEGDIEANRKNWNAATAAYRTALQKSEPTTAAVKLHATLVEAGKRADADRFAAAWPAGHPQDAAFRLYLGDVALTQRDFALAQTHYLSVVKLQPQNVMALNNIAWLMVKLAQPGAVAYAEKANQLAPQRPALMDTLASALLAENQATRALEVQKKALEIAPDDAPMRLNLARIYLKTGDKAQARVELEKLAKLGDKFPDQAEVAALLKSV